MDGVNPKFAEFKSYNSNTWANIKNSPKFIKQFKRYLQEPDVSKLSDLQYVVNTSKAPLDEIKTAFKELFTKEGSNLFDELGLEKMRQLFGDDIDFLDDFLDKADDLDSSIYNFIKPN